MTKPYSVLELLLSLCENKIHRGGINHLVNLSVSYAFTYLKYRHKNLNKLLMAEDLTLKEMAVDSVAPLFERNEDGVFIKIRKAFIEWDPKIESEEAGVFFLNRLAAKSVEKYITELLRDSDPFFSKILDSVNYRITKQDYKKKHILGVTYIVEDDSHPDISSLPDNNFITQLPAVLFYEAGKVLPKVFHYIKVNSDKAPAIPLNALVMKIKLTSASGFLSSGPESVSTGMEIESVLNKALDESYKKLFDTYQAKNKITPGEADGIRKALQKLVNDMKDGGISPGLHKYFLEQFPVKNFSDYEENYQNMFEYLYKILKKNAADQIKD